jgi:hypothetical protein
MRATLPVTGWSMSLQGELTMPTNAIHIIKRWGWRRILFMVVAGVITFFLLTNLFRLAAL